MWCKQETKKRRATTKTTTMWSKPYQHWEQQFFGFCQLFLETLQRPTLVRIGAKQRLKSLEN